jgi:hypothetical protein
MRQEMLTVHPPHQQIEPSFETMAPTLHAISQNLSFVEHWAVLFDRASRLCDRVLCHKVTQGKERSKARNNGVSLIDWKNLLANTSVSSKPPVRRFL